MPGKRKRSGKPMKGFSKLTFGMDGAAVQQQCQTCKREFCFCAPGLVAAALARTCALAPATYAPIKRPLTVFGCGDLGARVAKEWIAASVGAVRGITLTSRRHDALRAVGVEPSTRETAAAALSLGAMLICFPPSGKARQEASGGEATYVEHVRFAADLWSRGAQSTRGRLVLVSSAGVYAKPPGGSGELPSVDETSRLSSSSRAERLLAAEAIVLRRGGTVLRLAGLYSATRGPHASWLRKGKVKHAASGVVNLLHYDDAAAACVAALRTATTTALPPILNVGDGRHKPLTRRQICAAALRLPAWRDSPMPSFPAVQAAAAETDVNVAAVAAAAAAAAAEEELVPKKEKRKKKKAKKLAKKTAKLREAGDKVYDVVLMRRSLPLFVRRWKSFRRFCKHIDGGGDEDGGGGCGSASGGLQ